MRKKIAAVILCTAVCLGFAVLPGILLGQIPDAAVCTPKTVTLRQNLKVRGVIEPGQICEVNSPIPVCAGRIAVSPGQQVKKGDLLCTVDRESTRSAYRNFLEQIGIRTAGDTLEAVIRKLNAMPEAVRSVIRAASEAHSDLLAQIDPKKTVLQTLDWLLTLLPDACYAPEDGCVTSVGVSYTALSAIGRPLFVLGNPNRLTASLSVPEQQIRQIRPGQPVVMKSSCFPGSIRGTVEKISDAARTPFSLTGAVPCFTVTVTLPPSAPAAGSSVTAVITTGPPRQALTVPYEAVRQNGECEYVRLFRRGTCVDALVKTGQELSGGVEILSGVPDGSVLLILPGEELPRHYRISEGRP